MPAGGSGEQDLMEFGQLVADIWGNDVARFFSLAVGGVLALSVLGLRFAPLAAFGWHGAALCTTLGVLGTFTGIFLGLLEFDVAEIDRSVPQLLEGLKIAFSTSIVGMSAAVLLRIVASFASRPETAGETTPEAIHRTLREIDNTISESADRQAGALADLRAAVSADSDSSVVTQTQKLRISVEDGNRQLIAEFKRFAETIAENNSRALIEALEQVVRDFNTQLNEQFGENFKQLNQAVGALLEWQERYKSHVETTEERIEAAVAALQTSEIALRDIAEHATRIPEALEKLRALLNGFAATAETLQRIMGDLGAAMDDLKAHLEAVASLKDRALESFPTIEKNIAALTEGFAAAIHKALSEQDEAFAALSGGYEEMRRKSGEAQDAFRASLEAVLENVRIQVSSALDAHTDTINNSANVMQRQHQEQLRQSQDLIEKRIQTLDQGMERTLTHALETMSRQLASLSEKFAEDYEPLTQRLKELLDAVGQGNARRIR